MQNHKLSAALLLTIFTLFYSCETKKPLYRLSTDSPDGKIKVAFTLNEAGEPLYAVNYNDQPVVLPSSLGFDLEGQPALAKDFEVTSAKRLHGFNKPWEMPWGEKRLVENNYNQSIIQLTEKSGRHRTLFVIFMVYNDGLGFRYVVPPQPGISDILITEENTQFNMAGDYKTFWGPGDWDIYEHLYTTSNINQINAFKYANNGLAQTHIPNNAVNTPVTMIADNGVHISLHEANLTNYSDMTLLVDTTNHSFKSCLVGSENHPYKVSSHTPLYTPWRTIQISPDAAGLIESDLIVNLNEPNKLGDVSWVKPMKYIGIWWDMHLNRKTWDLASGNHGATTAYAKELIDFASKHHIQGLLVEGWNTGWENWIGFEDREGVFDFVTPYPDYDLEEVVRYGKQKGVELIMHHETSAATQTYTKQLDTAFHLMNKLGIHGVKTGYVGKILPKGEYHHGQYMVNHYQQVVETAAKYHVMVDVHEPIKATGLRRTYPNFVSREGLRGQEFNAWSADGGNPPEHLPIVAFTRMLAGPIDFTPGIFNIKLNPYRPDNQVNTTLAQQLALYVVIYSPIQMAADLIENYKNHPAFQFIEDVPVNWEQTKVLNGEVGDYVTIARQERNSHNWFVGGITDENPRDLSIKLDFLPDGITYHAILYKDAPDAHWNDNPTAYEIETMEVTNTSMINVHLAPGGGFALSLME
ncbi:MAG: glycoside hydrolase family 97 protein [Bacteroidales bacterium]|jgi:hypothetical protein